MKIITHFTPLALSAVAALTLGLTPNADATIVFSDNFEDATTVPGPPNNPQVGSYPAGGLAPESTVVTAGGANPASPGTGTNILSANDDRNYFDPTTTAATGDTIRLELDAQVGTSGVQVLSFGLIGDSANNGNDSQLQSIWIRLLRSDSTVSVDAYNQSSGAWQSVAGLSYTPGQWQNYAIEYIVGESTFELTAGAATVTSSRLNVNPPGTPLPSSINRAFLQASGGTNGFADNISIDIVPEPASITLVGLGLAAMLGRRRSV